MSSRPSLRGFIEEAQEHISNNSSLGLNHDPDSGPVNFTIVNKLDVDRFSDLLDSQVILTIYDEGSDVVQNARRIRQTRTIRFLYKGNSGNEAMNRCWILLEWLWNQSRSFNTDSFRVWIPEVANKFPGIVVANESGQYIADFVITFLAYDYP